MHKDSDTLNKLQYSQTQLLIYPPTQNKSDRNRLSPPNPVSLLSFVKYRKNGRGKRRDRVPLLGELEIDEPPRCGEEIIPGGGRLFENESLIGVDVHHHQGRIQERSDDVLSPFQPPDGIESKNFSMELLIELFRKMRRRL